MPNALLEFLLDFPKWYWPIWFVHCGYMRYGRSSKGPRVVLMTDCQLKWPNQSIKENDIFSLKKIVGSTLEIYAKGFFSLDKYQWKIWVENSVFATQHTENRKKFPPPRDQLILLHIVEVLHFTHHIKWHDWSPVGMQSKCSETKNHKNVLGTNFAQTCK